MPDRLPSVPARTLGEVRLDEGNFGASHTRCADVAGFWRMGSITASRDLAQVVVSAQSPLAWFSQTRGV
jgi:hypothetical protein